MNERILSVFRQLSAAFAPTGCEQERISVISGLLSDVGVDFSVDRRGSLTAVLHGREIGAGLAFVTHIDSHGMMVTSVSESGISFEPSADLCTDTIYGKLVTLGTADRRTDGVVCAVPLHLTSRRDALKIPDCCDMFISVGNPDVKESMADFDDRISSESGVNSACGVNPDCCADGKHPGISPGDYIAIKPYDAVLGERLLASTSTESCSAAASMLAVLIGLSEEGFVPRRDISFIFAVGGKSAVPDAVCAVRSAMPSAAIYVAAAAEHSEDGIIIPCKLGRAVCAPELRADIASAAERIGAAYRVTAELEAPVPLRALQTVGAGIFAAVIAVPTEMPNAARQICSIASLEAAASVISAIAESDMLGCG